MGNEGLTFCWKEGMGRVHILNGDRCVCLMPSAGMTEFSTDFLFGYGLRECESCRALLSSQGKYLKAEQPRKRKPNAKKQAKAYLKRLKKDYARKAARDGSKPVPKYARHSFYESDAWRSLRFDALRKNNGRCELCGASKHEGAVLHVDHIKPRSRFPELSLVASNLQVLCEDCNLGKGNRDTKDFRRPEK